MLSGFRKSLCNHKYEFLDKTDSAGDQEVQWIGIVLQEDEKT